MLPYRDSRIVTIALIVFFLLLIGYAYYEGQAVLYGPQINIPAETVVVSEPFTVIRGQAEYIVELRINGAAVTVTEDGSFEEPYLLTPGENRIVLDATDKYGGSEQRIIEIMYIVPPARPVTTSPSTSTE